jgi:C-terminal processing protease CtpA/Prc
MISLVASYLFGEEPIQLSSIYWRDEDLQQQYWSLPYLPGKRLIDIPVYVLTSRMTFSGAEEFASILQTRKRAIILGDRTDGGAHPGASYRLHAHFEVFIPIGRAINPLTGGDLEGLGVFPDIPLPQEHAYLAAYSMALKTVMERIHELPEKPFQDLAIEARSALDDLAASQKICPKCGYQNPVYKTKCKNCDEALKG